jgi:3-hydroxyisobutyrate dehydrogenase-like beta-hydroxyacid dehydrogenase
MEGEGGILGRLRPGQLVIDTGTSRPATDVHYERLCAEREAGFVDAPLTWRGPGQIIMVGGTEENYRRAEPVLRLLSYKLRHVGPIGAGQVLKLINQAVLAGRLAVYAEAVELAKQQGVDPHLLREYLEFDVPEQLYGDDFSGGGQLALHYKDLGYLLELAHDSGASIPITSLVHEVFKTSKLYGDPSWLQVGIASYWRRLNGDR